MSRMASAQRNVRIRRDLGLDARPPRSGSRSLSDATARSMSSVSFKASFADIARETLARCFRNGTFAVSQQICLRRKQARLIIRYGQIAVLRAPDLAGVLAEPLDSRRGVKWLSRLRHV